jgi:TctA family transporter
VLIVSHVISVALSFLLLQQMVWITRVRSALILPAIVLLVLFGGYSDRNAMFDVFVTLGAGLLGMLMQWLNWPRAPLVLGLVLGKVAENNLFISYSRYGWSFLSRPMLIAIILVSVVIVFAPLVRDQFARRAGIKGDILVAEAS